MEDPAFTIKDAMVVTSYPGATLMARMICRKSGMSCGVK
ncbi:cation/multidrug efflux pump [Vibrio cholerae]|nr:cation/multidrug efflux pump [Vibrio cholerae]